jgi:hypothetical protein
VVDYMQFSNENLQWNISLIRLVHDWKVDLVISFFDLLYSLRLRQGGGDRIYWIPSKTQTFKVRSFYHWFALPLAPYFRGRAFGELRLLLEKSSRVGGFLGTLNYGNFLTAFST